MIRALCLHISEVWAMGIAGFHIHLKVLSTFKNHFHKIIDLACPTLIIFKTKSILEEINVLNFTQMSTFNYMVT
jgi:hypothetical protein